MKELIIKGISKYYGKHHVLKEINKTFNTGKLYCLLGPSGCGKTTLLRIIAGLEKCDSGSIVYDMKDITAFPAEKRNFSMVFQSYALFPNLTIEKNIAYGLNASSDIKRKRVGELLELVGLPGIEKKYPTQLSGGQQQRVSLARSLATDPDILLLDEPLSALDAKVRFTLRQEIRMLQKRLGITMIMVTHDQEEAMTMGDEIILMNYGIIEQQGSAEILYKNPSNLFCSDFIGMMNYIPLRSNETSQIALKDGTGKFESGEIEPNEDYILGIRPEDIIIEPPHSDLNDMITLESKLENIEYLGVYRLIQLRLLNHPESKLTVYIPKSDISFPEEQQTVSIGLPIDKISIFKKESGMPHKVTYKKN